jgi:Kelch motif protein
VGLGFHKAKTVGTKTYLISSNSVVRIFDHNANTWSAGTVASTSPFTDPSFDVDIWTDPAAGGHTYVLAISSDVSGSQIDVSGYDVTAGNAWAFGTSLATTDHRWQAISVIGNSFYLAGGFRQFLTTKIFNGTYSYNLGTDAWTTTGLGTLVTPRQQARAVNLNGAMVLLGGTKNADGSGALREAESYSVANNTWSALPPMLRARINHAAVVLGGKIYAVGGDTGDGVPINKVEAYTP